MSCATFVLPSGQLATAGPGATLGRSSRAAVRLSGPGVAAWHARIAPAGAELVLVPIDGRIRGFRTRPARLRPGAEVGLGGVVLTVRHLGPPPARLEVVGDDRSFAVGAPGEAPRVITGLPARVAGRLLAGPVRWEDLAAELWPDDAAIRGGPQWTPVDERRYRNRLDQQLAALRALADDLCADGFVRMDGGRIRLVT